jgi:hypothetical protein
MIIKKDATVARRITVFLLLAIYVDVCMHMFFACFRRLLENEMVCSLPLLRLWLTTNE